MYSNFKHIFVFDIHTVLQTTVLQMLYYKHKSLCILDFTDFIIYFWSQESAGAALAIIHFKCERDFVGSSRCTLVHSTRT